MPIDVVMPQLGESVVEGTITKWLVKEGDIVTSGQTILEVATEKADSEVPSPVAGRVAKILAAEGATLRTGTALAQIEEGQFSAAPAAPAPAAAPAVAPAPAPADSRVVGASPSVRQLAREHDIDLQKVVGSGEHGRITQDDVRGAARPSAPAAPAAAPVAAPAAPAAPAPAPAPVAAPLSTGGPTGTFPLPVPHVGFGSFKVPMYIPREGDKVVPFSRKRRITADHMVYSKMIAPHVVTVAEVDLHKVTRAREENKAQYKKEGIGLTFLTYICMAAVKALRLYPGINARVVEGATVQLRDINLGVAVDAPDGLVVPNLKHADELSLKGMARAIGDLAGRARDGKLTADDFSGSSFTVTNPGLKGNLFGGAIISQPNVAILRMGEIKKRVVVVEEDGEDRMVIHPVMYLALSYDHRVIDGVLGNEFLWTVADLLRKGQFEP